jgi:hypothetical protein
MDRLPKKEAIQKTKKTKVEKPKPHLLDPEVKVIKYLKLYIG